MHYEMPSDQERAENPKLDEACRYIEYITQKDCVGDDRDPFEKRFAAFFQFDPAEMKAARFTDDDGLQGYEGLSEKYTAQADDMATVALQFWHAAIASSGQGGN